MLITNLQSTLSSLVPVACSLFFVSATTSRSIHAQARDSSMPKFDELHSNLGLQEIIELAVPLRKSTPVSLVPPPPVPPRKSISSPSRSSSPEAERSQQVSESEDSSLVRASVSSGVRLYQTNNVLRTKGNEMNSGVYELNLAAGLSARPAELGKYVTFIPRIDLMTQWATYGEKTVKDLLGYQFSMIKGSVVFGLPADWSFGLGLEYDYLSSLSSGDKMFDANALNISIQKFIPFTERSFLMLDSMVKYSNTNRVIPDFVKQAQAVSLGVNNPSPFVSEGVFADDGDNLQTALNLTYVQSLGSEGKILLMPSLGFTRTSYVNNDHKGRIDYLLSIGAVGVYQFNDWLSFQTFLNYSNMSTNEIGERLLDQSSEFNVLDLGVALNGNYSF
jgi:hypothetical protein